MVTEPDTNRTEEIQIREPGTGRFVAGAPSANPKGRPKKGETLKERLARKDAAIAAKAIKARDKRLMQTNMVGAREWTTYLAYNVGVPAQKYIIEQADNPLLALLTKHVDVVEGEARLLDQGQGE